MITPLVSDWRTRVTQRTEHPWGRPKQWIVAMDESSGAREARVREELEIKLRHHSQPCRSPTTRVWPLAYSLAEGTVAGVWLAGYGFW